MTHAFLHPSLDGEKHINVWSKGNTELGRLLSNFTHTPFAHPRYGPFHSMEGFWYWLSTGQQHDDLRFVWGHLAKKIGKQYPRVKTLNFEETICEGHYYKIIQTPGLAQRFAYSTLPFYHYYWYGILEQDKFKIVVPESGYFQMDYLEDLRNHLRHLMAN